MFRKLMSNISFSPALVGQLGFYAKRLRKEETTRRLGLIFTALALIVQSFAIFSPPQAANASSPADFVPGGVTSIRQYLENYDANTNHIRDLFNSLGITRGEIAAAKDDTILKPGHYNWSMTSLYSYAQGQRSYSFQKSNGATDTVYYRPMALTQEGRAPYPVFAGYSAKFGWFAIKKDCGNLITKTPPHPVCPSGTIGVYPDCKSPQCPKGSVGTYPNCKVPSPPMATCTVLAIEKVVGGYQFSSQADTSSGATISEYVYTIKKDGQTIATKVVSSDSLTNTYLYQQTTQGNYTVTLTVKTSTGDKTAPDCVKTFSITPPAVCNVNPQLPATSPDCQPCPGDSTIWIKDAKCSAQIVETKTAVNATQGNVDATQTTANASDEITYTLSATNRGLAPTSVTISDQLAYVLQYATIVDNGNGTVSDQTISWPSVTLAPGQTISRLFTVRVMSPVPATGQGTSDASSYNCTMTNTFGNNVIIPVNCPTPKQVEQVVNQLPHTGPGENMLFAGIVLSIVVYFYARSRQLGTEVRLIRRDLNAGTI